MRGFWPSARSGWQDEGMRALTLREPGRVPVRVPVIDGAVLGRDPACEIVLSHRTVSRRHARLTVVDGGVRLVDLGSTHGMFVEGRRVEERLLRDGDGVHLGSVLLEYSERAEATGEENVTIHPLAPPPTRAELGGGELGDGGVDGGDAAVRLAILYDISRAVGSLDDPDEVVAGMLVAALDAFRCERGVVELSGAGAPRRIARSRDGSSGEIVVSRAVQAALLTRRERVLLHGAQLASAPSMARQGVRAAMGVPLLSSQGPLGFIYVDDRTRADRFTTGELDFLTALAHLTVAVLDQARERRRLESLVAAVGTAELVELAGASPVMDKLRKEVSRYAAARDTAVLIRGESGSGKELVARLLHAQSPRARGPFVAVNCAAIPETMIESELFGHERGAFTGAARSMRGKLALADGGTLFLDEVGDLSLAAQAKLLRALENGEVQPLGSERVVEVDTRIVSATHKPLEREIAAGRFRDDLYYRLAVGEIRVPPLRERGDDVLALAELFRGRLAAQLGRPVTGFGRGALEALRANTWPGNVRQLRNEIERAVILADGPVIEMLGSSPPAPPRAVAEHPEDGPTLEEAERRHIEAALRAHGGNILATAKAIGVSRGLLYRKIDKFGLKK